MKKEAGQPSKTILYENILQVSKENELEVEIGTVTGDVYSGIVMALLYGGVDGGNAVEGIYLREKQDARPARTAKLFNQKIAMPALSGWEKHCVIMVSSIASISFEPEPGVIDAIIPER